MEGEEKKRREAIRKETTAYRLEEKKERERERERERQGEGEEVVVEREVVGGWMKQKRRTAGEGRR